MKKVAETHHLQKRGDTWYFVRRVPLHLVPIIGRTFVKKSLGTPDLKVAKARRNAQEVAADALFASAEAVLSRPGAVAPAAVSMALLTEHLRSHIASVDARSAARLATDPPENEAQKAEMKADAEIVLGILKNRDDPRGEEWVDAASDKIVASTGGILTDREVVSGFAEVVRRGLMELQHRKLDRYGERHDRVFHDPLFDPARAPAVAFSELVETFLTEKMKDYAANARSDKSADRIKAASA